MRQNIRQNNKIKFTDDAEAAPSSRPVQRDTIQKRQRLNNNNKNKPPLTRRDRNGHPKDVRFFSDDEQDEDDHYDSEDQNEKIMQGKVRSNIVDIKAKARSLLQVRKALPVFKVKDELISRIMNEKVCVLIGETGSGKSTQIPQFLMPHNKKSIAVTQPRRVAAMNLATRVAQEHGCVIGSDVGYSVRFNNVSSRKTKLKYITDGMLLREMMLDPLLSRYTTIIIDEAHERTILTDLLLGFLKDLLVNSRKDDPDFRVIIMSATLDAEKFSEFFNNAPILFVEGRMYPVEKMYLKLPVDDVIDSMVKAVIQINMGEPEGDILCFLAGQEEIDKAAEILEKISPALPREAPLIVPMPLYAALPSHIQMKVFQPLKKNQRKVILSTNIAETSVTVSGIKYVVDSGLRKVKVWRHQLGLSTLLTVPISKASATQRSGRAGRETKGKCFRLFREKDYIKLTDATEPEILRSEIVSPVLTLKKLGVDDILNWYWLENPGVDALKAALQQLYALGALDNFGNVTSLGEKMAILPVAPHLAAVLIQAYDFGVISPVIDIVSCLSVDNLMLNPASEKRDEVNARRKDSCALGSKHGDLLMLKELYDIFNSLGGSEDKKKWCRDLGVSYKGMKNVSRIRKQLREYMNNLIKKDTNNNNGKKFSIFDDNDEDEETGVNFNTPIDPEKIIKSFLKGFITNTAIGMPDRSYRTVTNGELVSIHPSSLLFGTKKDGVMYIEYVYTVKGYARNVTAIELEWLQEVAPYLTAKTNVTE